MARQRPTWGAPRLIMGPCIVEIDRIVIRYVQYQFEVSNYMWVWSMWVVRTKVDRIVIRDVQNEEVNFQGSSAYSVGGENVQYQLEMNRCRNEEVNFQRSGAYRRTDRLRRR
ncbi:hypothetical protein DPMN_142910 [Dreissena polymorpha]|uniref:Uncharacterized protein n=1 Tax=Dreissena polymorpha TaxID=45954 RepID=A0A9D4JMM8_DREPO|nr:hypothetical protein DPMN_142910 [Dreissena polymorpha]